MLATLQVEHSALEKEQVPKFIQQISGLIDVIHDNPHTMLAAATEGQSVEPSSVTKSEAVDGEISSTSVATTSSINSSPLHCSSPSHSQKETKPGGNSEVE